MAGFTLKIRFTGMWVYVPARPVEGDNQANNELRALAVETRDDHIIKDREAWHHPFLLVPQKNVSSRHWPSDRIKSCNKRGLDAFQLDGRTLSVLDAERNTLSFRTTAAKGFCPNDCKEERDFRWLLQMESMHPGKGKVDRTCLKEPQRCRQRVAAQVHLTEGEFSTLYVSRDCDNKIIRWKVDGGEPRALAEMMELQVKIRDDHVWLSDDLWKGGRNISTPKAIRLAPEASKKDVVVLFKNMPWEYLWEMNPRLTKADEIQHFGPLSRVFDKQVKLCNPQPAKDRCATVRRKDLSFDECLPERVNDPQCPGLGADSGP